jgi:surface antigen
VSDPQNSSGTPLFGWGLRLSTALIVGGFLSAWPIGADAQINPFRGYKGPTLSKEDLDSGQAAAGKLLHEDQAEVGKSEDWAGPTSGNTGSISIQKTFQRQGMECRVLRSEVHYKKTPTSPASVLNLNVCRIKTGEWKLM